MERERSEDTSSICDGTVAQSTFGAPRVFTQRVNIPLALTVGLPLRERSEDTSSICDGTVAPLALTAGLPQVPPQAEQLLMTMSLT